MQKDLDFRSALEEFLSASHLPTDDPNRAKETSEWLAGLDDQVILNDWHGLSAFDSRPVLEGVEVPVPLHRLAGQPYLDLDLLRELCPQVVIGKPVGAGHSALRIVPDQINAMLRRFIDHADAIAAEMVRTGGVFQYHLPLQIEALALPPPAGRPTVSRPLAIPKRTAQRQQGAFCLPGVRPPSPREHQ